MLDQFETKNLFRLQSELIDRKIDMTVSNSIDKIIDQINCSRMESSQALEKAIEKVNDQINRSRIESSQALEKAIEKVNDQINCSRMESSQSLERAIEKVNAQITQVTDQVNQLRADTFRAFEKITETIDKLSDKIDKLSERVHRLEIRVTAVETRLGMVNERQKELRNRFFDYSFRAGWLVLGGTITFLAMHTQLLSRI